LTIVRLGEAKMSAISEKVQVARQDIYRVTAELQKIGLVEKVIAAPIRYRATPICEAVPILLRRIHKERTESEEKAIKLMERYKEIHETARPLDEPRFVFIPEKETLEHNILRSIENAQMSIDTICSWMTCTQALLDLSLSYRHALENGVKMRWISNKPKAKKPELKNLQVFLKNPFFKLRFVGARPVEKFGIFDKNEVYIAAYPQRSYVESPCLWSNNASLIELAQHYFDALWSEATQAKLYLTSKTFE
jgi:sugar-specific transcriptional regulator TrmB